MEKKKVKKTFIKGTDVEITPDTEFDIKIGNYVSRDNKMNGDFLDFLITQDYLEIREIEPKPEADTLFQQILDMLKDTGVDVKVISIND